jgi:1-phosphofructokinase/tagatose 6-phosphate kinase
MDPYHLVVCLNPTLQKTFWFPQVQLGQVNRVSHQRDDASGKGINVTRVLTQLDERAVHVTQTGGSVAERFLALAEADQLDVRPVEADIEIRNCYTLLDAGAGTTTELVEAGHTAPPELETAIRGAVSRLLGDAKTLVLTGSKAPGFSKRLYPDLVEQARGQGVYVALDVRGDDLVYSLPYTPDLVKINVSEFSLTFLDTMLPEETASQQLPTKLLDKAIELSNSGSNIVLTNGKEPTILIQDGQIEYHPVIPAEPVNAIGCGDAVTAGILAGIQRGMTLQEALQLGHDCAARNLGLEKPGSIR